MSTLLVHHPRMVNDAHIAEVREILAERTRRLQAVRTRTDALAYQRQVRQTIRRAFGPLPVRTPLAARVTSSETLPHCRLEKVVFASRPGYLVSANCWLPLTPGPHPAVLFDCGHNRGGKAAPKYQACCQRLAAAGFATLIIDPIDQGERLQFGERGPVLCDAHNNAGKKLELCGEFFGLWRAWDGMRGLDWLLARPDVDASRVGMTGNSGGGTMTTWMAALEPRLTMSAPGCFVTSLLHNLENELPADSEQYPPGILAAGLDHADFLIAAAPRPCLLLGQHLDFFDRRGLVQAQAELARVHRLLGGRPDACQLHIDGETHGLSPANQRAVTAFFARHAGLPRPRQLAEDAISDLGERTHAAGGSVLAAGSRPIHALIADRAAALRTARRPVRGATAVAGVLRRVLHVPRTTGVPHHRCLPPQRNLGRYAVDTDPGIRAFLFEHGIGRQSLEVTGQAALLLPHRAAVPELAEAWVAKQAGALPLWGMDPRGLGESQPNAADDPRFWGVYAEDYMAHGHELMLGRSLLGRRVHDAGRVIDLLRSEGCRRLTLLGHGQGSLVAVIAGLLAGPVVQRVVLRGAPASWHDLACAPLGGWPAANHPFGILRQLDLPDLYRALGRRLQVVEWWGADMQPRQPAPQARSSSAISATPR